MPEGTAGTGATDNGATNGSVANNGAASNGAARTRAAWSRSTTSRPMAGVSTATVSRVVHGMDRVKDSTRARVLEVIEQLGYVPDSAAQSLSRRRKDVIGLVCVERSAPKQYDIESMSLLFYDEILRGVESTISAPQLVAADHLPRRGREPDMATAAVAVRQGRRHADRRGRRARRTSSPGWPHRLPVLVIAGNPRERAADVVTADNRSGSVALVTHLIEVHGRRRLYFIDGPSTAPDAKERRRGLTQVLRGYPECELVGTSQGQFSVRQRRGGRAAAAGQRRRCLTRSSARTTRWRSACCIPSPGRACACPKTWPWSASTTSSPAACAIRR